MPYIPKEGIKQLPTELPAPMAKSIAAKEIEAKTKDYLNSGIQSAIPEEEAVETAPDNEVVEQPTQDLNAELGAREVRKGIQGAGMTTDVESNAAQEVAPRSSEGILSAYKKEHEASPQTQEDRAIAAQSERELMDAEVEAQKAAGIETSQEASAAERKQIMDERANAGVEQKRQMYLRMGEFFANWGSTPGAPLVAGLKAMKETLPGVMDDSKAHIKLMRDINKSENDLNHAVRLEQMGLFDKASLIKEKASDRILQHKEAVAGLAIKEQIRQETFAQQKELEAMQQGGAFSRAQLTADRYDSEGKSDNVLVDNLQKQIVMDSKSLENLDESSIEYKNLVNDITNNREKLRLLNKTSSAVPPPLTKEQIKKNWARQNNIG